MAMAAALDQTAIPPAKSARKTVPECTWPDMYFYPVRQGRGRVCEVLNAASRALENRFPRRASDFFSDLDRGSVTLESARLGVQSDVSRREAHDERASSTKTSSVASPRSPLGTHAHAQQTCSRLSPRVLPPPRHRRRDLRGRRSARPFAGSRSRRVAGRRSRRRRRRPVPASRYRMASGSAPPG